MIWFENQLISNLSQSRSFIGKIPYRISERQRKKPTVMRIHPPNETRRSCCQICAWTRLLPPGSHANSRGPGEANNQDGRLIRLSSGRRAPFAWRNSRELDDLTHFLRYRPLGFSLHGCSQVILWIDTEVAPIIGIKVRSIQSYAHAQVWVKLFMRSQSLMKCRQSSSRFFSL